MPPSPPPFHVLYVCTGNICRSAVGERLLRLRLIQHLGQDADLFEVSSAGVQGLNGEPMDADSAAALRDLGGDETGFTARRLDGKQITAADLILTANRKHRSSVVRVDAGAARRTFTIREFARLAESVDLDALPDVDPSTRLQSLVEEVAATRGTVRPDERSDFDVEDPYGGPPTLHQRIADQIDEATTVTADLLADAVRPPGPAARAIPQASTAPPPKEKRTRRRWFLPAIAITVLAVLAAAAWLAWSGLSARDELEASRPLVRQARQQVLAGDTAQAKQTVTTLQGHTSTARRRTDGPLWALAGHAPFVGDDITAVRTMTTAVDDVAQHVLPPLLRTSDSLRPDKLRAGGNGINLAPLEAAAPSLRAGATRSSEIQHQVDGLSAAGLTAPVARALADVRRNLAQLSSTTASAARAAELIPPMLGADGKRRYFLAFQTPAESRGTGGLLGAYGVLAADNGRITVEHLGPNTELTNPKKLPIDLGPDWQDLYGRTPPWWVNGNVSPNFPDAGQIWTAMWSQEFGEDLDGVIATDPVAMGYLLKATGPAQLPGGGQVTAANAASLTMKDVYDRFPSGADNAVRDRFLQKVAGAVFAKILSGQGDPKALADQLVAAAGENRLLVYSTHGTEQLQLEQTGLSGAVPETTRPFAGLVVNNYSGSKLDYYLDRTLAYRRSACLEDDGSRDSTITVTLHNGAPTKGLPAYVDQQLDRSDFAGKPPHGANTDYVEVLATNGANLAGATLDGQELLVAAAQAQGHPTFAFNVTMLAGQTRTIVLKLVEPRTHGAAVLMSPQPLVRPMAQQASTLPCP